MLYIYPDNSVSSVTVPPRVKDTASPTAAISGRTYGFFCSPWESARRVFGNSFFTSQPPSFLHGCLPIGAVPWELPRSARHTLTRPCRPTTYAAFVHVAVGSSFLASTRYGPQLPEIPIAVAERCWLPAPHRSCGPGRVAYAWVIGNPPTPSVDTSSPGAAGCEPFLPRCRLWRHTRQDFGHAARSPRPHFCAPETGRRWRRGRRS